MKVLHIYKDYYPVIGGIENHIRLLCRRLKEYPDIEPAVLVTNTASRTVLEERDGIKIVKVARLGTISSTPISLSFTRWIRRLDPDLIHLHFPSPIGELAFLWSGADRKMILTYHSDVIRQAWLLQLYKPFLRRLLRQALKIIVSSPNYVESSPHLRPHRDKCVVIPFGIDLERFKSDGGINSRANSLRHRYGTPLVLFVGLLRYYKGLSYLIEAMKQVEAILLIVGEGPRRKEWEARSRHLGLNGKVHFLGAVSDDEVTALYHACDLLVLPSIHRSEALGIVQLEAMACGKPVICTELGTGTTFINIHESTGLVVPPADSHALGKAIERVLADENLRARMGLAARQRIEEQFSDRLMAERIVQLYRSL